MPSPIVPLADPTGAPRLWWVCFTDSDSPLYRLLPRGWRHCYALTSLAGLTVLLQPLRSGLWLDYHYVEPAVLIPHLTPTAAVRLEVPFPGGHHPRGIYSCVSAVKAAVGLTRCWAVTPQQLHRAILERGGVEVWPA